VYYIGNNGSFSNPWQNCLTAAFEPLTSPTLVASTISPIAGNVTVSITYPAEATSKEYKQNNETWASYTEPIVLTMNDTILARCYDANGKPSYTTSKVVDNILNAITADPDSTTVIDQSTHIIYGLHPGMSQEQFEADYIHLSGNIHVEYNYVSGTFGTGTQVNIVDGAAKSVLNSYTVVIFGDVNGDGNIDSIDAGKIVDIQNYMASWNPVTDAAFYKAADVNGDGNIDSIDAGLLVDSQNYMTQIDQTTGLAG
jgi:hypothetical protein